MEIDEFILGYNIVQNIQNLYSNIRNENNLLSFHKYDIKTRIDIGNKIISQTGKLSIDDSFQLIRFAFNKSGGDKVLLLCKSLIPKILEVPYDSFDKLIKLLSAYISDEYMKIEIFSYISESYSKLERTTLWTKGLINRVEFDDIISIFDKFEINNQPTLLRKIFSIIAKNKKVL